MDWRIGGLQLRSGMLRSVGRTIAAFFFVMSQFCSMAQAGFPDKYRPIVIEPPFSFSKRLIDLTVAVKRAKSEGKLLFIYLGAADCPPCLVYESFLEKNYDELKPSFQKILIVDIRTWIRGPDLVFKINEKQFTIDEFKTLVGDGYRGFFYPYHWLVSAQGNNLHQVKQLPQGSEYYTEVENHKWILSPEK